MISKFRGALYNEKLVSSSKNINLEIKNLLFTLNNLNEFLFFAFFLIIID